MSSLFTRILSAQAPGHVLWQDALCFCLLASKPLREGHVLVIPKVEIDFWDEMEPPLNAHIFHVSASISRILRGLFPCRKVGMMIGGLEVRHAHIHLIPIESVSELDFSRAAARSDAEQEGTAQRIREALSAHD
ncbi:MAG: HIT family protein [Pseudomonadales bacterium]|nr:HIT family protein [Pseudomonadales bacterium]